MTSPRSSTLSDATLSRLADLARRAPHSAILVPILTTGERVTAGSWERCFSVLDRGVRSSSVGAVPAFPIQSASADAWEERAAIMEHDGGLPRAIAERMALSLLLLEQMDSPSAEAGNLDRELTAMDRRGR